MTDIASAIVVITTVGDKDEARRLANALIEGKIEHGEEYRVLFKTVEARYDAVERAIRELHSYELPAIHAVPFTHISELYATWIEENAA
jgi:periplasmic divalent cation tolerance protein